MGYFVNCICPFREDTACLYCIYSLLLLTSMFILISRSVWCGLMNFQSGNCIQDPREILAFYSVCSTS